MAVRFVAGRLFQNKFESIENTNQPPTFTADETRTDLH